MEESTNQFEYEPLDHLAHEIRLLVLEPHSNISPEDQVRGRLFNVSLNDPDRPTYEAISYVWGDAAVTNPILLQDKPFKVTRALWTALRYLRPKDKPKFIWVDAICINQEDMTEREQHVRRMSDVYRHALRGLLWMDIPSSSIQHILSFLENDYPLEEEAAVDFALTLMNSADVTTLKEYNLLCANPVWGRSWIVQELILSPTVEVVTHGSTFNVKHIQYLAMAASRFVFGGIHKLPQEEWNRFNSDSSMPTSSYGYQTAVPPVTSIVRAWQYFSDCRSTDVRDRIYALLSIVNDNLGISPDYRISPIELFSKVARASIYQSKTLDVLCLGYLENSPMSVFTDEKNVVGEGFKQHMGLSEGVRLPSWLPPFNIVGTPSSTLAVIGLAAQYNAGKWHSVLNFEQLNSFEDPDILTLSGLRIDAVGPLATTLYEPCLDIENVLLRNFVNSMPKKPYPKTYFTGEDSFDAYWRTSIFDRNCTVGRLDHALKRSYRQIAASLIAVDSWLQGSHIKKHPFLAGLEIEIPDFTSQDVVYGMNLFKSTLVNIVNYRFNITESGYMAMIPRGTEEGDIICILLGSQVAHVLRPVPNGENPNSFTMIGIAYIHGFMDGEAVEMCQAGELIEEMFHLV